MRPRSHDRRAGSLLAFSALGLLVALLYLRAGLDALARVREAELADALAVDHPGRATARAEPRAIGVAILARNIFDSQTGPLAWEEAPPPVVRAASEQVEARRPLSLKACAPPDLRLVASIVNAARPEHSFAALRRGGKTHLVPLGKRVGELSLLALFPTAAHVRVGDREPCAAPVYLAPDQRDKPEPVVIHVDTRPTGKPFGFKPQELANEIRPLGGSRYRVSRMLLLRALASPRAAGRGMRLQPVERHGSRLGFALSRLGKNSLLTHLGLQQGDLVRSINGHELVDLAGLRAALRLLRKHDSITLSVMRNNVPHNLQYTLD
jgi:hypothetical protein